MTNDFESEKKYVPYKEMVKKRALDYYYYANKEVKREKSKSRHQSMSSEKKKGKRILKDG